MKKNLFLLNWIIISLVLIGCEVKEVERNKETITVIPSSLAYYDDEFVHLNVSSAFVDYAVENELSYNDDEKQLLVNRTPELKI